jgi:pantetheine-phosphate adenylyltransferase
MRIAVFPGGFDPVTYGHLDLVRRMTHLFDRVVVAVVKGRDKGSMFEWEDRIEMFRKAVDDLPNVEVEGFDELMVEFARKKGAVAIVRGIRAVTDFENEFDMALMNRKMADDIESVFMMTAAEHLFVSATRIRELSGFGRDVSDLVPPAVNKALLKKFADRH